MSYQLSLKTTVSFNNKIRKDDNFNKLTSFQKSIIINKWIKYFTVYDTKNINFFSFTYKEIQLIINDWLDYVFMNTLTDLNDDDSD